MNPTISQATLKKLIHYDPDTGIFTWLERDRRWFKTGRHYNAWNARYAGEIAGSVNGRGYCYISLFHFQYKAHRLAFLYMDGAFPPHETDHINGIKSDNRWINIRAATTAENQKNAAIRKDNTSGVTGVIWHKPNKKWLASIQIGGKRTHIGLFKDLEAAAAARKAAEAEHGYHPNHGRPA